MTEPSKPRPSAAEDLEVEEGRGDHGDGSGPDIEVVNRSAASSLLIAADGSSGPPLSAFVAGDRPDGDREKRRVEEDKSAEGRGKIGEGESVPERGKSCGLGGQTTAAAALLWLLDAASGRFKDERGIRCVNGGLRRREGKRMTTRAYRLFSYPFRPHRTNNSSRRRRAPLPPQNLRPILLLTY